MSFDDIILIPSLLLYSFVYFYFVLYSIKYVLTSKYNLFWIENRKQVVF